MISRKYDELILRKVYKQCEAIVVSSSRPLGDVMKHLYRLAYDGLWEKQKGGNSSQD